MSLLIVLGIVFFLYKSLSLEKNKHSSGKKQSEQVNELEQQLDKDLDQYQKKLNDALKQSGASN